MKLVIKSGFTTIERSTCQGRVDGLAHGLATLGIKELQAEKLNAITGISHKCDKEFLGYTRPFQVYQTHDTLCIIGL